jgi:diguanylate cyclase
MALVTRNDNLIAEALEATALNEWRAYYHPLVKAHGRSVCGVEALVRWQHRERGLLTPAAFLAEIETTPHIRGLTEWMLHAAIEQCCRWRTAGRHLSVSVNLSPTLIGDSEIVHTVASALERHGFPASLLTLEVTENALMADPLQCALVLSELKRLGVRLSIDDFGTGYTSFSMLKEFRFDEIKIDQSFVKHVRTAPDDAAIVRSILELGHRFGLEVVAEGVEDEATATLLGELGCDVLQGYYFTQPMPADKLDAVFSSLDDDRHVTINHVSGFWTSIGRPPSGAVPAALPSNEDERLAALDRMELLDTEPETEFDDIVELAAAMLGVPTALLSLVDRDRQWFKASVGVDATETSRDTAFCAHAILDDDVMEVRDARDDQRFAGNPLVTGDPHIRFYAGAPLVTSEGQSLGTLCVIDSTPRSLSPEQKDMLRRLSRMAVTQMESRRSDLLLGRLTSALTQLAGLRRSSDMANAADTVVHAARELLHANGACLMLVEAPGSVRFRSVGVSAAADDADDIAQLVIDIRDDQAIGAVIASRESIFIGNAAQSDLLDPRLIERFGVASALYLPIIAEESVVGTIVSWWTEIQPQLPEASLDAALLLAAESGATLSRLQALEELRIAADTDPLTGLANRRGLLRRATTLPPGSSIAMLDLDEFKVLNDHEGHQAGDQALRSFASHLRALLPPDGIGARWGGEEFVVALPGVPIEEGAELLHKLHSNFVTTSGIPTTFSGGLVGLRDNETSDEAIRRADGAMYEAKHQGRNRDVVKV